MTDAYHLKEFAIALDPTDPRHANPPPFPSDRRVLDIGCGAGQTLIACYGDRRSFGIDVDLDALRLGRTLTKQVSFVCAAAEHLPFRDGGFDVVISRVALPYTDCRRSLREIRRILKPGGFFWAVLHPISIVSKTVDLRKPRTLLRFAYVTFNSLLFHFTSCMVPYRRGRYETFQTSSGIQRALRVVGFAHITVRRQTHFIVTAEAASVSKAR